jgi:hypothetical protein
LDAGAMESMVGPTPRNRFVSRSFPYTPPPRHALREPVPTRGFSLAEDHLAPQNPAMYGRRRSVSLSFAAQQPQPSHFETGPQYQRQNSHPPNLMPAFQTHQSPGHMNGFGASRDASVKDRKAMAQKRRATMQNVIADARLPSSITRPAPQSAPSISLQQALDSLNAVESYLQSIIMGKGGEPDLTFVTTAHCHLIKDLQCRLKHRASEFAHA